VVTLADYDMYCHYVAGLVGIGLSQLFASSGVCKRADRLRQDCSCSSRAPLPEARPTGLEEKEFAKLDGLSNGMGLLLQKTNIIRDYLEACHPAAAVRSKRCSVRASPCCRGAGHHGGACTAHVLAPGGVVQICGKAGGLQGEGLLCGLSNITTACRPWHTGQT